MTIIGVGVTNQVNTSLMEQIVTQPPSTYYFNVTNFADLSRIVGNLVNEACATQPPPSRQITTTAPAEPITTTEPAEPITTTEPAVSPPLS